MSAAKYYVTSINEGGKKMSRIGKLPITIPSGVTVTQQNDVVTVKGPKGELKQEINPAITIAVEGNTLTVTRPDDERQNRAYHGLYRSLLNNMVIGVSQGYKKELELVGVGYRAANTGNLLDFSLGYTHNIYLQLPPEIKVETKSERNKNPLVILESADKQLIGQVCAKIRSFRKVEPYKGKGVRFVDEVVRRKSGKSASK
ncbi:50S ribosomal protein L6 [Bacteroidia bacterium]|nr:50S ribosomal protein L6 [Bacteroidia bacterium]